MRFFSIMPIENNHVNGGINTWSKFDGHKFYSYCRTYKIFIYYNVLHEAISNCFHGN